MVDTVLYRPIQSQGVYSAAETYYENDLVRYTGNVWLCVRPIGTDAGNPVAVTGVEPNDTNTADWFLFLQGGGVTLGATAVATAAEIEAAEVQFNIIYINATSDIPNTMPSPTPLITALPGAVQLFGDSISGAGLAEPLEVANITPASLAGGADTTSAGGLNIYGSRGVPIRRQISNDGFGNIRAGQSGDIIVTSFNGSNFNTYDAGDNSTWVWLVNPNDRTEYAVFGPTSLNASTVNTFNSRLLAFVGLPELTFGETNASAYFQLTDAAEGWEIWLTEENQSQFAPFNFEDGQYYIYEPSHPGSTVFGWSLLAWRS